MSGDIIERRIMGAGLVFLCACLAFWAGQTLGAIRADLDDPGARIMTEDF